jgi:hypothetical protein
MPRFSFLQNTPKACSQRRVLVNQVAAEIPATHIQNEKSDTIMVNLALAWAGKISQEGWANR